MIDVDGVGLVPGSLRSGLIGLGGVDLAAEDVGFTRVYLGELELGVLRSQSSGGCYSVLVLLALLGGKPNLIESIQTRADGFYTSVVL